MIANDKKVIKTGKTLGQYIDAIISEATKQTLHDKALTEKEKQNAISSTSSKKEEKDTNVASKTMEDDAESMASGDVKVEDVIEKLNTIRSGKSFRDEHVKRNMQQYVDSLSKAERTALLAFVKGIAQIVTGEVEPEKVVEPGEYPANVSMKKDASQQKKHIEPNVIKAQSPVVDKKRPAEDVSGPVPITPKKK